MIDLLLRSTRLLEENVFAYSSKRWVISLHQVPNPRVIIMAEARERKQRKALPTASTNAERKEL